MSLTITQQSAIKSNSDYNKATPNQRLAYYAVYRAVRIDAYMNPSMVEYKGHIYHLNLTLSARDNSRVSGYRYGHNGWNDKNKLYDMPGAECYVLANIYS